MLTITFTLDYLQAMIVVIYVIVSFIVPYAELVILDPTPAADEIFSLGVPYSLLATFQQK